MELGNRIYRYRTERNLSQGDLADALGVSRQSVSKWENGNATPDLDKLVKMAKLFDVTLDEMVTGSQVAAVPPQTVHPRGITVREVFGVVLLSLGILLTIAAFLIGQGWTEACIYFALVLSTAGTACCWPEKWMLQTTMFLLDSLFLIILAIFGDPISAMIFSIPFAAILLTWLHGEYKEESQ